MPRIELALVLVTAALALLPVQRRRFAWLLVAVPVALLAAQLLLVGPHWQILPGYAGAALAVVRLLTPKAGQSPARILSAGTLALCGATVALLWVLPVFELPAPTGNFAVGTTGPLQWTNAAQKRELVAQIWYPATPGAAGERARYARRPELKPMFSYQDVVRTNARLGVPLAGPQAAGPALPIVLFGPRWGGARTQDTFLLEDLASHGYVVVAVDHPGNAARMMLADGRVRLSDRVDALDRAQAISAAATEAVWAGELGLWIADDAFVLDQLARLDRDPTSPFAGRLDMNQVGALGHSFGGAVAMGLLGRDPRVRSAVNLDGWTFQGVQQRGPQPALFVYASASEGRQSGVEGELTRDDNRTVEASLARFGGFRAYVAGTQHMDFTDQTLLSPLRRLTHTGPAEGARVRAITRGLVLGFFDQTLRGAGALPRYPEVRLETWPAPDTRPPSF